MPFVETLTTWATAFAESMGLSQAVFLLAAAVAVLSIGKEIYSWWCFLQDVAKAIVYLAKKILALAGRVKKHASAVLGNQLRRVRDPPLFWSACQHNSSTPNLPADRCHRRISNGNSCADKHKEMDSRESACVYALTESKYTGKGSNSILCRHLDDAKHRNKGKCCPSEPPHEQHNPEL